MEYKLDKAAHSVYVLQYHLVQVVKYRKNVFIDDEIIEFLKQKTKGISSTFEVEIINQECDKDHIHIIFKAKPTLNIPKYLNALKTITSREIKRNFPEVKKKFYKDAFWSSSYFLTTTGQVTLDQLKEYVDSQDDKRRS